jgi:nucleoside-diphosphate-sugar epimerase
MPRSAKRAVSVCAMRLLVTGGSGVIGRAGIPLLRAAGHDVVAPRRDELDLFDPRAAARAVVGFDAVAHLASRIGDWPATDRLRTEATRVLVDAALAAGVSLFVQASIAFVEQIGDVGSSALDAERETARFAETRRGVVLRFGLLDGPGTGSDFPAATFGSTLHVEDAGRALVAALALPSGIYRVDRELTESRPVRL